MTEAKFTPGPWSINEWPQATSDIAIGAVGTPLIARVPLRDVSINEQKANAHLIAAAPELYCALQELLIQTRQYGHEPEIKDAEHALAKARGESHE